MSLNAMSGGYPDLIAARADDDNTNSDSPLTRTPTDGGL